MTVWIDEVRAKLKRKNQILFTKDSSLLQELSLLVCEQSHRTLVLWALDLAEESVLIIERKYPNDERARNALEQSKEWSHGNVKMAVAKRAILDCHAMAKEINDEEDTALLHAIAQACSVVHTPKHASGYPIYELTYLVRKHGIEDCQKIIEERNRQYITKLLYYRDQKEERTWASFIR